MKKLTAKLKHLPDKPGVYIFKGKDGKAIYVGKAKSLKKRIASYFRKPPDSPKTEIMLRALCDFEYIVTSGELEAIMLESNFIKKLRPRYNVILRDDKQYPYIKLTLKEAWPRLFLTRLIVDDKAKYFGPYSGGMVRETLRQIRRLFPIRWCKETPMRQRRQPCMYFYIKRCEGPCVGEVDHKGYMDMCRQIIGLLEGKLDEVVVKIKREMMEASERLDFERARVLRDRLKILEKMAERQAVVSHDMADRDVIAFSKRGDLTSALVFQIRGGKLVGREIFYPHKTLGATEGELMTSVLAQYYADAAYIPPEVVLQHAVDEMDVVSRFLSKRRGTRVRLTAPSKGKKLELIKMAEDNARLLLERKILSEDKKTSSAIMELKSKLGLSALPIRIEAFDVSNIQGTDVVGSMVTFVGGAPYKRDYRRFKIRTVKKPDDVAAIYEIVKRRYSGSLKDELELPDLALIDGGAGQVGAARKALDESGLSRIPVIALAKRLEQVYVYGGKTPLKLPKRSTSLHLLQRIRDEAHRFAITYHRLKRRKRMKGG